MADNDPAIASDTEQAVEDDDEDIRERLKIQMEMDEFSRAFHGLSDDYELVEKIGEGTFSSVYKAIDLNHDKYNNSHWDGSQVEDDGEAPEAPDTPPAKRRKSSTGSRISVKTAKYVALKRIYVTSSPNRIENEIDILADLRKGALHHCVTPIITATRFEDQVICVLPYAEHVDFREYYRIMSLTDIKCYFMSLFSALIHVHSHGIIHRDIKPSNFLYDMSKRTGVLVDFGLAQREWDAESSAPKCKHIRNKHPDYGTALSNTRYNDKENAPPPEARSGPKGIIKSDKRPQIRANRAGTRGFRAPEVLFKCTSQSTSLDVWSAGIILLSILTQRFPFFNSNDDVDAMLELACIFGKKETRRCAALHSRTFDTNIPTIKNERLPFEQVLRNARPGVFDGTELGENGVMNEEAELALDLLEGCLMMDVTRRITAEQAFEHEFLAV